MNKSLIFPIIGLAMTGLGGYLLGREWKGSIWKAILIGVLIYTGGFLQL